MRPPVMFRLTFPALLLLIACASPSPEFSGAENHTLDIEGDRITVFYKATRAQAIRTNYRSKELRLDTITRLTQAIEKVTGCAVRPKSLKGDTVLVTATLKCP